MSEENDEINNKENKNISKRKRRELIYSDSDNDDTKNENNTNLQNNNNEEVKEEQIENINNERTGKYSNNKFNTLDRNIGNSPVKDNLALQEKLKKIFMNRDKLKFQYTKQDIPDNLKYHSDDSDSSEVSGLRKSKISKKNNQLFNDKNKENEFKTTNKKTNRDSSKNNNDYTENNSNEKNNNSIKEENVKSIKRGERRKKFNSCNINNDINNEEEEKIINNYEEKRFHIFENKNDNTEDNEENKDDENNIEIGNDYIENNEKKNLFQKFEKDKNDTELEENNKDINIDDKKQKIEENEEKVKEAKNNNINKKQKLLKLLIEKKNNSTIEHINDKENNNQEENKYKNKNKNRKDQKIQNYDEDKQDTIKMNYDEEKESRRRKLIKQIKSDSNSKRNRTIEKIGKNEIMSKEKDENEEKEKEDKEKDEELDEKDDNDKGTYIFNSHRNKLTINIKPKENLQKQISISKEDNPKEDNENIKEDDDNEKNEITEKSKKTNALINILEKLKQKKSNESKGKNIPKPEIRDRNSDFENNDNNTDINKKEEIDESEIEREAEKIRKKEKKIEERRKLKEKRNNTINNQEKNENNNINNNQEKNENNNINNNEEQENNNYLYKNKRRISAKELKNEEIKRRKKLEEDLKAEINKKESFNENKEDEVSTVNNSKSNLINISYSNSNVQMTQNENEEKNSRKEFSYKPIPNRITSNNRNRYKKTVEENIPPTEIVLNDIPSSNLDRSFDAANAYMKRKIPKGKNSINIYKPKKANNNNLRQRSKERNLNELIENDPKSFNPNNNVMCNNTNFYNSPNHLYRNKNTFSNNNNFVKNNHSFCEYPIENSNPDSIKDRNITNMEIDIGGGLNSSFDAYMKTNTNNYNNKISGNNFNTKKPIFYGNDTKKFNTSGYNKKTNIPISNHYNKNPNDVKSFYKNENVNKSYGYINTGFNNNIFDNKTNRNFNNNSNNLSNSNKNINSINNKYSNRNIKNQNENNYFYGMKNQQFITYNNNSQNSFINYNNNIPLKTYTNQNISHVSNDIYENSIYPNPPNIPKRYTSTKNAVSNITTPSNIKNNNYIYNNININNTSYQQYQVPSEKNTSINIEDLLVLEEKFKEIIIGLNRNRAMHNECFEFWNYYFNCSLYGHLEKLFKEQNDSVNVQISINHILISVMICYDFSFEIDILNGEYSILEDILNLNHRNLMIIYEHIMSKISSESKTNIWVLKLNNLISNFNQIKNNNTYYSIKGRQISSVEKIIYNTNIIVQNIRVLLKNYKTKRIEYLTSIFKKINDKSYEEINIYFRDNILRVDNLSGSVLASVYLKDNEYFQTEPAPYIKTKNRKPYSLILDLDETLVHFKINNEDENEGVLQIRPGVVPFLEQVGKYYELIVFTAATQDYGDLLIDAIEENNLYFEHRFYRQHTIIIGNDFVKDLNRIGRPLDKIIIVDNMPQNFRLQKENGINIKAFWGEDADDNALEELGIILTNIAKEGGDLRIGLEKYKDEIVRKITSNISKNNY